MAYSNPEKQREYQRQWVAKRRAAFFQDKVCVRCGSSEDLQLDHIDPKMKVSHSIWSWSEAKRLKEIAKCQVLCDSCHRQKSIENRERGHGETAGRSYISTEQAQAIKDSEKSTSELMAEFGMPRSTINSIRRGVSWKYLK